MSQPGRAASAVLLVATLLGILALGWGVEHWLAWRGPGALTEAASPGPAARAAVRTAWQRLAAGEPEAAGDRFRGALEAAPGWPEALAGLARAQAAGGRHGPAVLALSAALAREQQLAPAARQRAEAARRAWQQRLVLETFRP